MSPDGLGWADERVPALRLFDDEVPHCKDLSQCLVRVHWLLRNKYLQGLKGCSRDSQQEGDQCGALL